MTCPVGPAWSQVRTTSTGFVDITETGALTPVILDPSVQFDHIVVRFDYIGPGQPQQPGARVQDFVVGRSIIPDDQVISFGVTVTDGDGDTDSSNSPATALKPRRCWCSAGLRRCPASCSAPR